MRASLFLPNGTSAILALRSGLVQPLDLVWSYRCAAGWTTCWQAWSLCSCRAVRGQIDARRKIPQKGRDLPGFLIEAQAVQLSDQAASGSGKLPGQAQLCHQGEPALHELEPLSGLCSHNAGAACLQIQDWRLACAARVRCTRKLLETVGSLGVVTGRHELI